MYLQAGSDGSYRMYVGLVAQENFYQHRDVNPEEKTRQLRELLLSREEYYASWACQLKAFISDSEGPFRAWHLFRMNPEEVSWGREQAPGVTLLGDAAHVSTPFVGEGVNCSMADSVHLAEQLIEAYKKDATLSSDILEPALASYESEMFVRGQDLIRRSTESESMIFGEDETVQFQTFISGQLQGLAYDMKPQYHQD